MKGEKLVDESVKSRRPKSREVSSRFLLSPSSTTTKSGIENATQSPRQMQRSSISIRNTDKSLWGSTTKSIETSGFMNGLWPSTTPTKSSLDSLNDHLKHDRNLDHESSKNPLRQRSCTEFGRSQSELESGLKENHRPSFGSSMRYAAGKFKFPGKLKVSSSESFNHDHDDSNNKNNNIEPGRLSVDGDSLRRKSFGRKSNNSSSMNDSESGHSDLFSGSSLASYMAPTASSRQYGIEVSSKYSQDLLSKSRRWSSTDHISQKPSSADTSPNIFKLKNEIRKTNSFSKYGTKSGISPGRSDSPVFDSKPPSSPSRKKGVGGFISIGLELFKGRKSSSGAGSTSTYLQPGAAEDVHQLKLFHNSLIQWRYCNARAQAVNLSVHQQAERNLTCGLLSIRQMQQSVQEKKIMLEKEKLNMKLRRIIYSQIRLLEAWGNMERQYQSALSETIDHLRSAVCRIPLVDGTKAEHHATSIVIRQASDFGSSIMQILSTFSAVAEDYVPNLAELAEVVTQEKLMLEDCLELFKTISTLEIQERSLKCTAIQGKNLQKQPRMFGTC